LRSKFVGFAVAQPETFSQQLALITFCSKKENFGEDFIAEEIDEN
jgi:hypothetical protein